MLARKDNPKKHVAKSAKQRTAPAEARNNGNGDSLELNTANFLLICGLNGLRPVQIPALIDRSKQAIYKALRNPRSCPVVFDRLDQVLPKRRLPNDLTL